VPAGESASTVVDPLADVMKDIQTQKQSAPAAADAGKSVDPLADVMADIKAWIATHGAVAACMTIYQDLYGYTGGVYRHVAGDAAGGHCVCLVGYDDAQGCWIAKNSWNTGWGEQGFFRIAYGECALESWSVQGTSGVSLRAWFNSTRISGLWASDQDGDAYAFTDALGWLRLGQSGSQATLALLADATSARAGSRPVNVFADGGTATQLYVF